MDAPPNPGCCSAAVLYFIACSRRQPKEYYADQGQKFQDSSTWLPEMIAFVAL
jgi:hypothetical protein